MTIAERVEQFKAGQRDAVTDLARNAGRLGEEFAASDDPYILGYAFELAAAGKLVDGQTARETPPLVMASKFLEAATAGRGKASTCEMVGWCIFQALGGHYGNWAWAVVA